MDPADAPTQVGTDTDWATAGVGENNSCAVKSGGTLWCWGSTAHGQLGLGPTTDVNELLPVQVGTDTGWSSVSGGRDYTLATRTDGSAWGWGNGGDGQVPTESFDVVETIAPLD